MYCLTNFCCVCLKNDENLLNLNTLDEDKIPIINKMIFVAFGHERLDVNISKLICNDCFNELNIAYKFKTKCLMSNEVILGYNYQLKYFSGSHNEFAELNVKLDNNSVNKKPEKRILKLVKCEFCPVKFKNKIAKKYHQIREHSNKIFCKYCSKRFPNLKKLRRHIFDNHFHHSTLFCKICNQTYCSKESFKKHLKRIHQMDIYFCNNCNIKFVLKEVYLKHKAWHAKRNSTNIKPPEMPVLTPEVVEKPVEIKELKVVTRYLVCNQCDEIFVTQNQLTEHLKTHLIATEVVTFPEQDNNEMFFRIENVTTLQENGNNNAEIEYEEEKKLQQCETCQNLYYTDCEYCKNLIENNTNMNISNMVIIE